jgi:hypothetical protein
VLAIAPINNDDLVAGPLHFEKSDLHLLPSGKVPEGWSGPVADGWTFSYGLCSLHKPPI